METEVARKELSRWAAMPINDEDLFEVPKKPISHRIRFFDAEHFKKKYGIVLIGAVLFTLYTIVMASCVHAAAVKQTRADMLQWHEEEMATYKAEQAQAIQAASFLSGSDSLNVAINQAVDAVAPVVAKLTTDQQKATEVCCMLARVLNPSYPKSFEEVASQPSQWMFFDGTDTTYSARDRQIAESIIRPYMESGIIPTGLTAQMVYAEWTPNDYILRDSYKTTSTMHTWRYAG